MLTETVFDDGEETLEFVWQDERFVGLIRHIINGDYEARRESTVIGRRKNASFNNREDALHFLMIEDAVYQGEDIEWD